MLIQEKQLNLLLASGHHIKAERGDYMHILHIFNGSSLVCSVYSRKDSWAVFDHNKVEIGTGSSKSELLPQLRKLKALMTIEPPITIEASSLVDALPLSSPTFKGELNVRVNMNDSVRFKLTKDGVALFKVLAIKEQHDTGAKNDVRRKLRRDATGHAEMPLWEFMQFFGASIYHGMPTTLFVDNSINLNIKQ